MEKVKEWCGGRGCDGDTKLRRRAFLWEVQHEDEG
jgi:hypothetical protein